MTTKTSLNSGQIDYAQRMAAFASNYKYHTSSYNEVVANLKGGGYVPISYLTRLGFYNPRNRYPVNSVLAPYLENGQIFDDSHKNDSQLVGGDTLYGDKTVYTFTLPADTVRTTPTWDKFANIITTMGQTSIDAAGNMIVTDAPVDSSGNYIEQAANMYAPILPTNTISTATTVSYTGFYVLLSVIGVAIVWKKSKRF